MSVVVKNERLHHDSWANCRPRWGRVSQSSVLAVVWLLCLHKYLWVRTIHGTLHSFFNDQAHWWCCARSGQPPSHSLLKTQFKQRIMSYYACYWTMLQWLLLIFLNSRVWFHSCHSSWNASRSLSLCVIRSLEWQCHVVSCDIAVVWVSERGVRPHMTPVLGSVHFVGERLLYDNAMIPTFRPAAICFLHPQTILMQLHECVS